MARFDLLLALIMAARLALSVTMSTTCVDTTRESDCMVPACGICGKVAAPTTPHHRPIGVIALIVVQPYMSGDTTTAAHRQARGGRRHVRFARSCEQRRSSPSCQAGGIA